MLPLGSHCLLGAGVLLIQTFRLTQASKHLCGRAFSTIYQNIKCTHPWTQQLYFQVVTVFFEDLMNILYEYEQIYLT